MQPVFLPTAQLGIVNMNSSKNKLLAALKKSEYERLLPQLEEVFLPSGQILHKPNEPIKFVYFPTSAVISLTAPLENLTIEIGIVGNEGMVGLPVFWGGNSTINTAIAQVKGNTMKLDADVFRRECSQNETLRKVLLIYTQALFTQVSQNGACRANHTIDKQLARWLLSIQDCIQQDEFMLTQEFISQMLGVRRASVSEGAAALQKMKLISYSRGKIRILNRTGLESATCSCYQLIKGESIRLLGSR